MKRLTIIFLLSFTSWVNGFHSSKEAKSLPLTKSVWSQQFAKVDFMKKYEIDGVFVFRVDSLNFVDDLIYSNAGGVILHDNSIETYRVSTSPF